MTTPTTDAPELWGGVECTTNRVCDTFIDQTRLTAHHDRLEDLDRFAALGITRLRYPVLWERTAPNGLASANWSWSDQRLQRLRMLGVEPIVGLVHHGSGPLHTSLIDPDFPAQLASYARAVAERYPWVRDWTPINEPVTTARFSTLYGIWYPHARSPALFIRALLNQCLATAMAMREIRAVIPEARLIQTEDCGRVQSTKLLRYQAAFENQRQCLAFDLLTGKVSRRHPLWKYLLEQGASRAQLEAFANEPCPPSVIGVNYYVTSDRYLDHRLEIYPACTHGGNRRHRYADVEAARVEGVGIDGHLSVLRRLWHRYRLPLAITEAHLGGPRDDQLRWLAEAWDAATTARGQGIPVQAVTAWSLLGAFGWDQLVSSPGGRYESGVFDLRSTPPRPTALATMISTLAEATAPPRFPSTPGSVGSAAPRLAPATATPPEGERADDTTVQQRVHHPVAQSPGWWRRPDGVLYRPTPPSMATALAPVSTVGRAQRPLLITGGGGTLGRALARITRERGLAARVLTQGELDLTDGDLVQACVDECMPWAVINAAGYASVDEAESEPDECWRLNVTAPVALARVCRRAGIPLVTFSSDLVFDGRIDRPYHEQDHPSPLGVFGRTQLEAELRILELLPTALVIRSAAFFGPWDQANFVHLVLRALADGRTVDAADDLVISPTYIPDLVHAALDLLVDGERGIWHVTNEGAISWAELARRAAERAGFSPDLIQAHPYLRFGFRARRPPFSALATSRGRLLRSVDAAIEAYLQERLQDRLQESLHDQPLGGMGNAGPATTLPTTGTLKEALTS